MIEELRKAISLAKRSEKLARELARDNKTLLQALRAAFDDSVPYEQRKAHVAAILEEMTP